MKKFGVIQGVRGEPWCVLSANNECLEEQPYPVVVKYKSLENTCNCMYIMYTQSGLLDSPFLVFDSCFITYPARDLF